MFRRFAALWVATFALVLVAWAYAPLAHAGFLGGDLALWRSVEPASVFAHAASIADGVPEPVPAPLARASLALSAALYRPFGVVPGRAAVCVRLENLGWLLLAAALLAALVRRALLPWIGRSASTGAGRAVFVLVSVEPWLVWSVAHPSARGELIGLFLGALAALLFLRGRQERAPWPIGLALVAAFACGLASDHAWLLPAVVGVLELASARRYRPWSTRLRTATTTLALFGAAVVARFLFFGGDWRDALLPGTSSHAPTAALGPALLDELGRVFLPVALARPAPFAWAIAGALLFVAFQPALVAARSAPRLWGWMLAAWSALVLAALLPGSRVAPGNGDLSLAQAFLPAGVAVAIGLAVTSTALSGWKRWLAPLCIALGHAWLAHAAAAAFPTASAALVELSLDIDDARTSRGDPALLIVIDPPTSAAGLDFAHADELPLFLAASSHGSWSGRVITAGTQDVFALLGQADLRQRCERGLALCEPRGSHSGAPSLFDRRPSSLRLEFQSNAAGPVLWREHGQSPVLEFDPLAWRAVRVAALPQTRTAAPPRMFWRTNVGDPQHSIDGVWLAGEDGPVAWFELSREPAWLFGERVRKIWFEGELSQIASAEVLHAAPALSEPALAAAATDSFSTPVDLERLPKTLHASTEWSLELFDAAALRVTRFQGRAQGKNTIEFPGVEPSIRGPWTVSYRSEGLPLAQMHGGS